MRTVRSPYRPRKTPMITRGTDGADGRNAKIAQFLVSKKHAYDKHTLRTAWASDHPRCRGPRSVVGRSAYIGRTIFYSPRTALPKVYSENSSSDLNKERTRLIKEQADGQQLANAKARSQLIPADDAAATIIILATLVSRRFQGVGTKLAPLVHSADSVAEAESIISEAVSEALVDLSNMAAELD